MQCQLINPCTELLPTSPPVTSCLPWGYAVFVLCSFSSPFFAKIRSMMESWFALRCGIILAQQSQLCCFFTGSFNFWLRADKNPRIEQAIKINMSSILFHCTNEFQEGQCVWHPVVVFAVLSLVGNVAFTPVNQINNLESDQQDIVLSDRCHTRIPLVAAENIERSQTWTFNSLLTGFGWTVSISLGKHLGQVKQKRRCGISLVFITASCIRKVKSSSESSATAATSFLSLSSKNHSSSAA